jgi:tagatose 1,6-diphosphate aldolase GatY/KbaY
MVQAVIGAAEDERTPVILQTTPGTLGFAGVEVFFGLVQAVASRASVPVALHLDHGDSFELAAQAVRVGYTSVMYDGSKLPYEENVAISQAVTRMCHPMGVPVELELGTVGGKEDQLSSQVAYTDPHQAVEFVERTNPDFLAVAIGTAHGVYKGEPHLDVELLSQIADLIDIPLVLHGSSGLSDDCVRDCVGRGIAKVNFATELRAAFTQAVRDYLAANPAAIDPKKMNACGRAAVREGVRARMRILGCCGRA